MNDLLEQRLLRAVRPLDDPPGPRGWNHEELSDILESQKRAAAAVLVPIVTRLEGFSVLLTRRTEHLSAHGGQVSFPGGRMESEDADAIAAALRETREEVGIGAELLRPFGYLDSLETISGFWVTPVVAWLDPSYHAQPDLNEVALVFEVPLDSFLLAGNLRTLPMSFRGRPREVFEFAHDSERIWGATAAMLLNLVRRLEAVA
jgi:8-oxo-dGTP pyrophosphatase MutT (NUDIX family)